MTQSHNKETEIEREEASGRKKKLSLSLDAITVLARLSVSLFFVSALPTPSATPRALLLFSLSLLALLLFPPLSLLPIQLLTPDPKKTQKNSGMKKIVINHLDKLFVTSDAATIIRELEVEHPAANLLVAAAKAAQQEVGDGAGFVVAFAGELLSQAEGLLREGLTTGEVADGYARTAARALEILESKLILPGSQSVDVRDVAAVSARLRGPMGSKQHADEGIVVAGGVIDGSEKFGPAEASSSSSSSPSAPETRNDALSSICQLVARACISVCPLDNAANFNVDNVRILKVPGAAPSASALVRGVALKRGVEGAVKAVSDAKVAVYAQGFDTSGPETKGTVLLRSGAELEAYSRQEEKAVEALVAGVAASGATAVVAGGAFGELALHYLDRAGILALRVPSKFDLRRVCRSTGATALAKVAAPTSADLGFAKSLRVDEVGGTKLVVLSQEADLVDADASASAASANGANGAASSSSASVVGGAGVTTIVLRGATDAALDELERAADAGANAFKALCRDARAVPSGGAVEASLAAALGADAASAPGLEGYAVRAFAAALAVVPRTLAENSGLDAAAAIAELHARHAEAVPYLAGKAKGDSAEASSSPNSWRLGLDLNGGSPRDLSLGKTGVSDLFSAKWWALKLAADAATTVLRVDQIIMAKAAGGPRAPRGGGDWDED